MRNSVSNRMETLLAERSNVRGKCVVHLVTQTLWADRCRDGSHLKAQPAVVLADSYPTDSSLNMNAIPSLSLHTNNNSSGNSPKPVREAQASPSLRSRPSELTPAAPRAGLASVPSLSTLSTPAKRSYETALGSLPPYSNWLETASQAGRLPGEAPLPKRRRTGDETPVVMDASWSGSEAPLSGRFSSLPAPSLFLLQAPMAGRLSGLDIIERALSADDQTANVHIQLFLESTLAPGITFTTFVEGLKILTMHAALRRPSLQNWPPARIFREGISLIGAACTRICGPGQAAADRATMRGQMKAALFAQGTPHNFIMLATAAWRSTKKARREDQTLATSYYVLKELGVFSKLKAINDASVVESQLSCHERLDAMRMQLAAQGGAGRIDSVSVHRASEARPAMAWTSQALLG